MKKRGWFVAGTLLMATQSFADLSCLGPGGLSVAFVGNSAEIRRELAGEWSSIDRCVEVSQSSTSPRGPVTTTYQGTHYKIESTVGGCDYRPVHTLYELGQDGVTHRLGTLDCVEAESL